MRDYFMKTERIGFSVWTGSDIDLAKRLWGNPEVTKYICAAGRFTEKRSQNGWLRKSKTTEASISNIGRCLYRIRMN